MNQLYISTKQDLQRYVSDNNVNQIGETLCQQFVAVQVGKVATTHIYSPTKYQRDVHPALVRYANLLCEGGKNVLQRMDALIAAEFSPRRRTSRPDNVNVVVNKTCIYYGVDSLQKAKDVEKLESCSSHIVPFFDDEKQIIRFYKTSGTNGRESFVGGASSSEVPVFNFPTRIDVRGPYIRNINDNIRLWSKAKTDTTQPERIQISLPTHVPLRLLSAITGLGWMQQGWTFNHNTATWTHASDKLPTCLRLFDYNDNELEAIQKYHN